MKHCHLINKLLMGTLGIFMSTVSHAGPVWTFASDSNYPSTVSVTSNGTATVQYIITNQSKKTHTLVMTPITGISQTTSGVGICANPFTLAYQQSCTLSLLVTGSALQGNVVGGPQVCQQGSAFECYQPSLQDSLAISLIHTPAETTLSISLSTLALSIYDSSGVHHALSGHPRQLTITNTGSAIADNVTYTPSSSLAPYITSIEPASCGTMQPSSTCILTVTPNETATTTPITLTIQGDNTNTVTSMLDVLGYGSIYQEGYVYAIDDSYVDYPESVSVGGTIATLTNNSVGASNHFPWSVGAGSSISGAHSITDGASNTSAIIEAEGAGVYAASVCNDYTIDSSGHSPCTTGTCYTNWFLPALCQMGPDTAGLGCAVGFQNMVDNLSSLIIDDHTCASCLTCSYWSSTERSPATSWYQTFSSGGSAQGFDLKSVVKRVRCSRALTP